MAKYSLPSFIVTHKSSRNKNKGKASSAIFIDSECSDDLIPPVSVASSLGKLSDDSDDCGSSKKKFKFDFDSSLDKKVDFWNASHLSLFHYLKDKTLVHIQVIDLDILSSLDCHIKNIFEFQGWANIFYRPMVVYEPLICLFYANLRSSKAGEIESLVLGKCIFIDCKTN
ncbi:hypothetical protein R3W88_023052 [Solanum pinnatisectum]|uniref:Uncharacterized protein n=1 Tax=Solanum pinnatisectum TaxID=50273 RepID=A0AAV9LYJ0_9SOLN|nr:hypothetical protein R3W88_023052 [Solanum pinnatisectum]